MPVDVGLHRVGGRDAGVALGLAIEAGHRHEHVEDEEGREQRHHDDLQPVGGLADAVDDLGHHDAAPHEADDAPSKEEAPGNPLRDGVGKAGVGPRLRVEEVLHEHARGLLEPAAQDRGDEEHLEGGGLAEVPEHHREQAGTKAVERRERAPHEPDAQLGTAGRDVHPDHLEDEARHARHHEDDDVVVEDGVHVVEELLAHVGAGGLEGLDLLGREAGLGARAHLRIGRVVAGLRDTTARAVEDDLVGSLPELVGHAAATGKRTKAPAPRGAIPQRARRPLEEDVDDADEDEYEQHADQGACSRHRGLAGGARRRGGTEASPSSAWYPKRRCQRRVGGILSGAGHGRSTHGRRCRRDRSVSGRAGSRERSVSGPQPRL